MLPVVLEVTHAVREPDELPDLVGLRVPGQTVAEAEVLPADVVDPSAIAELLQEEACGLHIVVQGGDLALAQLMILGPGVDFLVPGMLGLSHRARCELLHFVLATEVNQLTQSVRRVDEILEHGAGQADGEALIVQTGDQSRQVDVLLLVRKVDLTVLLGLVMHHRDGDGREAELAPVFQHARRDRLLVCNRDAVRLQLHRREPEFLEHHQVLPDLPREEGRLTFRGDHGGGDAMVASELGGLLESTPVDLGLFGSDAVGRCHLADAKRTTSVADLASGDDTEEVIFHVALLVRRNWVKVVESE